jgi:hypothetical protein
VIGGAQKLDETYKLPEGAVTPVKTGELYRAGQLPLASKSVSIAWDPRDAVFSIKFKIEDFDESARFQDPAHRTDFEPLRGPQNGVPDLQDFAYLEAGFDGEDAADVQTFFYENAGTKTRYVTLAGYVRNSRDGKLTDDFDIARTRGTAIFGNQSRPSDIPTKGSATYSGSMLATLVSIDLDVTPGRSRFEWVQGTASVGVNFATGAVTTNFQGSVVPAAGAFEGSPFGSMAPPHVGATFSAAGTASLDSSRLGYAGKINAASFAGSAINIAATSLDGSFFGPDAVETGGAFRVIGATPDERVDFLGSFTGVK